MSILAAHISWLLALHIVAFTAWMAGIFYLPRLFVYHCQTQPGTKEYERFKIMERRLLRQIMMPAMIITALTGSAMASLPGVIDWRAGWWWIKLVSVAGLFIFQGACSIWQNRFYQEKNNYGDRYYRIVNEIPTLLMVIIVIMIIIRPKLLLYK